MPFTKKQVEQIRGKFPEESIQVKKGFKHPETNEQQYLTGFKPQYVVERVNDVFGHDGWDFEVAEHGIEGKQVWVLGRMTLYAVKEDKDAIDGPVIRKKISVKEQFGTGSYNAGTPIGDALKGASTNAFEKCASLYDVGHEAYKGLVPVPEDSNLSDEKKQETALLELVKVCKKYKVNKEVFPKFVKNVLKEEKSHKELSVEEMKKLTEHLEKHKAPF